MPRLSQRELATGGGFSCQVASLPPGGMKYDSGRTNTLWKYLPCLNNPHDRTLSPHRHSQRHGVSLSVCWPPGLPQDLAAPWPIRLRLSLRVFS